MSECRLILLEGGVVALDSGTITNANGKVIYSLNFNRSDMDKEYLAIKRGMVSDALDAMLKHLHDKGYTMLACNDDSLVRIADTRGFKASLLSREERVRINDSKISIMLNAGIARDEKDALSLLHDFAIALSSQRIAEASSKADLHIVQCINAIDELDKMINILSARIREWYGLHFPELEALVGMNAYTDIILKLGYRDSINLDTLRQLNIGEENRLRVIAESASNSKGGVISKSNIEMLKVLAEEYKRLNALRDMLAKHLEDEMEYNAPNIKDILGSTIGARIIAKVGSLERLAMLPASTIQVLGAEKALFRALKTGSRPPKHGIIFQHTLVHSAPRWQRGKIARVLATKVALAARVDAYSGIRDPSIMKKLEERVEEIKEKYKEGKVEVKAEVAKEKRVRREEKRDKERRGKERRGKRRGR